jgi:hypothetical protein
MTARQLRVGAAFAVLALAACDQATEVTGVRENFLPAALVVPNPAQASVIVCKIGAEGTFHFTASSTTTGDQTTLIGSTFTLEGSGADDPTIADGNCAVVASAPTTATAQNVTVQEDEGQNPANTSFVDIQLFRALGSGGDVTAFGSPITTNDPIQVTFGTDQRWVIVYRNELDEEEGNEGCTPGYWKQEQHFDSWGPTGFTTDQELEDVFDVPDALGLDDTTLLQALNFGGGSGVDGAARILLRAAVAALLNAAHPDVDYAQSTADIIADVNAALASGDRDTMLDLAADLDADNNGIGGCPLD